MSVGHIARALEEAGIPTVIISVKSFATRMQMMALLRVVPTNNLLGRVFGSPHEVDAQMRLLVAALDVLQYAEKKSTIQRLN